MKKIIVFAFVCFIVTSIGYAKPLDVQDKKQPSEMSSDEKKNPTEKKSDTKSPEIQVKNLSDEMAAIFKKLTIKLMNSDSDIAAAAVIDEFNAILMSFDKRAKAIKAEYPDYDFGEQNEKFAEENKRMEEAMIQFLEATMQLAAKYEDSEVFKKAIEKIGYSASSAEKQD